MPTQHPLNQWLLWVKTQKTSGNFKCVKLLFTNVFSQNECISKYIYSPSNCHLFQGGSRIIRALGLQRRSRSHKQVKVRVTLVGHHRQFAYFTFWLSVCILIIWVKWQKVRQHYAIIPFKPMLYQIVAMVNIFPA